MTNPNSSPHLYATNAKMRDMRAHAIEISILQ